MESEAGKVREIGSLELKSFLSSSSGLSLVDFWAVWCAPCRRMLPLLEEAARLRPETLRVFKVDVSSNSELAAEYGVQSIPTFLLFKGARLVGRKVGACSAKDLEQFIEAGSSDI